MIAFGNCICVNRININVEELAKDLKSDQHADSVKKFLIHHLNSKADQFRHKCKPYVFEVFLQQKKLASIEKVVYQVPFRVQPGDAIFQVCKHM